VRTLSLAVVALLLLAGSLQGRQPAAAIEELVGRMLAAQEQGDAEAYLAVWSERSPEIEGVRLRARGMASGIFGVQFSGAYLSRLQMDGDFASARLTALLDVVDVRDVHRGDALPRRVRQQELRQHLTFIREANGWRLWADRPAVEVLAGALLGEEDAARRDALLAAEPELATEELARAVAGHGDRWSVAQQWTRAAEAFRLAITLAERAGAEEALSSTLQRLGNALYFQGDLTGAHEHYRRKLEIDTARGDPESVSMAHLGMATVRYSQGAYGAALESYAHHLVIEEELGREEWQASAQGGIANIHYLRGEYPEALAAYRRALGRHLALRSEADVARTWHRLGQVHVAQGDYAGGLAAYERAYAAFERLDDRSGRAIVLEAVGQAQFHQGRHVAALQP
jgi:tetratricopeptide (TPR) repeat protein